MDRRLDPLGPRDGDQLDVAVDVAHREDALPAGFEVRIDGDAAVVVEHEMQPVERVLRGEKADLHDGESATQSLAAGEYQLDLIAGKTRARDFGRREDASAGFAQP